MVANNNNTHIYDYKAFYMDLWDKYRMSAGIRPKGKQMSLM